MATTTNYGWTTPDDTALVKDGASAIRSLGTAVDTTTKNLNPSTTLGDIEYRSSTANTNTRLGIGTTGQVLTVSSGVPAWETPSSTVTFVGASATRTSNLSVANNTNTIVDFDSEEYDTSSFHSTTVNPSRITIPAGKAGYYQIQAALTFANNATGIREFVVKKNGTNVIANNMNNQTAGAYTTGLLEKVIYGAENDYFQCEVFQNSGGALNLLQGTTQLYFQVTFIGA